MDKGMMINKLIEHFCDGNKAKFAHILGIKPQTINGWISRNTFDAELIYSKFDGVSGDWLLSGEGGMLKCSQNENLNTNELIIRLQAENDVLREVVGLNKRGK